MTTCCAANLMERLAIPLGCQKTATKWLVMRCCVLALTNLKVSLRRNFVVARSSPTSRGMWLRHNLKVSLHRNARFSRRVLRGALHLDLLATVVGVR